MTNEQYQQLALRTASDKSPLLHAVLGIADESGELAKQIKSGLVYGQPIDNTNLIEEAGDLLWFINLLLTTCGSSISEAMDRNIAKLRVRYPTSFTTENATQRDLFAERNALERS